MTKPLNKHLRPEMAQILQQTTPIIEFKSGKYTNQTGDLIVVYYVPLIYIYTEFSLVKISYTPN